MKKKFLLLPLLMLVLASCGPKGDSNSDPSGSEPSGDPTSDTSGDPSSDTPSDTSGDSSGDTSSDTSSDPSSDTSSGEDDEKQEIDPAGLNAILGFDVYSLLPKIYSNNYLVDDWSSTSYPVDVYVDLFDWELADAEAYELALSTSLELDEENGYVIQDNLYVFIYLDEETYAPDAVFGLNIYSMAEASEKEEIDPTELNEIIGFDVYSQIPAIYSNDYEVGDYSSEDYPVDIYIDLYDWTIDDAFAYDDELFANLDLDEDYGYIIDENLFVFVNYDSEYSTAYINIYSDAAYEPFEPEVSVVWPAQAINDFFGGSEIGGLVPSFESDADFSYYVSGEGDNAELIIYTDYATIDAEDIYVAALEAALWVVDDSLYGLFGYIANDPEEQISLIFYWYDGVMYWSFMTFYHEEPVDGNALIDFSTTDQRESLSSERQVWISDDGIVTLTVNKASATSGVVDYTNPVRIYANHSVAFTIEEGYVFDSIVITAATESYANVVVNSSITGGTASAEGTVVTITADANADAISFVASAQTRWVSLEVNYSEAI